MEARLKILVVDDEVDICQGLQKLFSQSNKYEVFVAESAEQALELLEKDTFALVLCDYKLGGEKTGLDVLFKAREKDPNVITILMIGFGTDQLGIRAVAEGLYDYITKPFKSMLDVKNVVERGLHFYSLLMKYNEKIADDELQKELLKETLEKARRTREILRMLVSKMSGGENFSEEDK